MRKRILAFVLTACSLFFAACGGKAVKVNESSKAMRVHFPKTDEGKCILIQLPDGRCILADCGTAEDFPIIYEYMRNLGIDSVDILAITYTDSCHMGGAKKIIQNFKVKELYLPTFAINVKMYKSTAAEAAKMNCRVKTLESGTALINEKNLCASAFSADKKHNEELLLIFAYKNNRVLSIGETDIEAENSIIKSSGTYIKSDVLAFVPGNSDFSPSPAFLQNISPEYAVVTTTRKSGKKLSERVSESLDILDVDVLRNDINGNIVITCTGTKIYVSTDA